MGPLIAQADPISAVSQLAAGANSGGAIYVLSAISVGACIACVWLGRALLAAKDQYAAKVEELVKAANTAQVAAAEAMKDTRELFQRISDRLGGPRP